MRVDVDGCVHQECFPVSGAEYLSPRELGEVGEKLATSWLVERGWQLVGTNIRVGHCEIDALFHTVAMRKPSYGAAYQVRVLVVVEVKTRRVLSAGSGVEALSSAKRQALRRAAGRWLGENDLQVDEVRFDVIECLTNNSRTLTCTHIEDAF